jgi:glycerol uptake facilitator-like aquaporin
MEAAAGAGSSDVSRLMARLHAGSINPASTIPKAAPRQLRFDQCVPTKLAPLLGDFVVDALVFEFMGLAILGLCVIVLAMPSGRQSSGRVRNH